jgi:hypothetical protein
MKNLNLLFTLIFCLFIISCKKDCGRENINEGIIINDFNYTCTPHWYEGKSFIIKDYYAFSLLTGDHCNIKLEAPDFSKHTLLGLYASGNCNSKFTKSVEKFESEKRYHYKITVYECGSCRKDRKSINLVLVPKIEEDWIVTFKVENIKE